MNSFEIDYKKSHGSYLVDESGKKYLDLLMHYASAPLGYNHPIFSTPEFKDEILSVAHIKTSCGKYHSYNEYKFWDNFKSFAVPEGFDFLHFASTGSLAVEAAVKTAWAHSRFDKHQIVTTSEAFHGLNGFGNFLTNPLDSRLFGIPNADWSFINESMDFENSGTEDIAAILVEPIQCTAGDLYHSKDFLLKCRRICDTLKIPLIFDEIQTGFGVTGKVWAHEIIGVQPDIIIFGKKAQVSGIIVKKGFDTIAEDRSRLSVTFDGDMLDKIRCKYIIKAIQQEGLLENISTKGRLFVDSLNEIRLIKNVRGMGGIIAFDFHSRLSRNMFINSAFENGLICNPTGENSVRLRPALNITTEEVEHAVSLIKKSI